MKHKTIHMHSPLLLSSNSKQDSLVRVLPQLKRGTKAGIAWCVNDLGYCYAYGIGTTKCITTANRLFEQATRLCFILAIHNLAVYNWDLVGSSIKKKDCLTMLTAEPACNLPQSQAMLGVWYLEGNGVVPCTAKAVYWLGLAVRSGNAFALTHLGWCYANGIGLETNHQTAIDCITEASQREPFAYYHLGRCYQDGISVGVDAKLAVEYFEAAAAMGVPEAHYALGVCYLSGEGVHLDTEKAFAIFLEAAEGGGLLSCYQIGLCYLFGRGVEKNTIESIRILTQASKRGCALASNTLGECKRDGIGCTRDWDQAIDLFRQAYSWGVNEAGNNIKNLEES
jgi:TPR repeat protein